MRTVKLTKKYQTTIPKNVREVLHLHKGDRVIFKIVDNRVEIRKVTVVDLSHTKALETTLSEWDSKEDDEAYH